MATNEIDDGLTEEERAALAEEDGSEGAGASTDDATQGADNEQQAEAAAAADKSTDDAAAAEQPAAAEAGADEQAAEAQPQQTPILVAAPIEEATAKLNDIQAQKDALLDQFDNGDMSARDYQKQLDALSKQERDLEFEIRESKLADKLEGQRLQNEWVTTCNNFIADNAIYKDNPRLYKALDAEVRELANDPKTASWTGQKFLEEAHKNLSEAFNLPSAKKATTKIDTANKRELPPNLSKVPSAEIEDTSGGRFAVLDRMATNDPLAYEEALAKMPEAERNAYLAS